MSVVFAIRIDDLSKVEIVPVTGEDEPTAMEVYHACGILRDRLALNMTLQGIVDSLNPQEDTAADKVREALRKRQE